MPVPTSALFARALAKSSDTGLKNSGTDVTESNVGSGQALSPATKERVVIGLDVFIVSFCVAYIAASDRFKALLAGVVRSMH